MRFLLGFSCIMQSSFRPPEPRNGPRWACRADPRSEGHSGAEIARRFLNMRVLIIDDERSIRTSTMVAIQAAGHQADSADSGQVAVLKLEEDAYDLAFLDLRLGV